MEELVGGSLSLEQRYDLTKRVGTFGGVDVFEGVQRPLGRPIWIHVLAHPDRGNPTAARNWVDRVRNAVLAASQTGNGFYDVIDFGDVDHGIPFIVYERDENAKRLSELIEADGAFASTRIAHFSHQLAESISNLTDRGRAHGALNPAFVFLDSDDHVHLIHTGIGVTRHELETLGWDDLFGLFSFTPDQVVDQTTHTTANDAFGVAALAYFCASGVHPFLSATGSLDGTTPRPLQEFGVEDELADAIDAQFHEETRDLDQLISDPQKPSSASPPNAESSELDTQSPTPSTGSPLATILTAAVVILLISNALVFLWAFRPDPSPAPTIDPNTHVLPRGVLLETVPSGVTVVDRETRNELGRTPLTVDPRISEGELEVELSLRGHATEKLTFSDGDPARFKIEMRADPE